MNLSQFDICRNAFIENKRKELEFLATIQVLEFNTIKVECSRLDKDEIYCNELIKKLNIPKDKSILYYFQIESQHTSKQIFDLFNKYKRKSKVTKLPQLNSKIDLENKILYVGKTNSNFTYRFLTHLTNRSPATFALHLEYWAKESGLELTMYFTEINLEIENKKYNEMLESILHENLNPILGRAGH